MPEAEPHVEHSDIAHGLLGSEELARLLLNSTGEGVYGIDTQGNCTFANPACLKLLGFEYDSDVMGKQMHLLVHHTLPNGDLYPVAECNIYRALQECEGTHIDNEVMWRPDGSSFPAEYWSFPMIHEDELVGCVVTFVDITERRQAEEELHHSEELVRQLLNSTGEGIYGIDTKGNCTFANPACLKLLGFESDTEVMGKNMHVLVHHTLPNGDPYPVEECNIYRALQECEGTHIDNEVMWRPDGSSFPAEYWSFPMIHDDELLGCVVTFVDITERRRTEEAKDQALELLRIEREKSDDLLRNVLPSDIAEELKENGRVVARRFDAVSVLFADIVGSTQLTVRLEPEKLIEVLNRVFTRFDNIADKYGAEKIRTIGDNYMVATGVPHTSPSHAADMANIALDMMASIEEINSTGDVVVQFRIGLNAGPVIAGVVGQRKFHYDIWGEAVNTASRMESQGVPGKIQITHNMKDLLQHQFVFAPRGKVEIKGVGDTECWFLEGRLPSRLS